MRGVGEEEKDENEGDTDLNSTDSEDLDEIIDFLKFGFMDHICI